MTKAYRAWVVSADNERVFKRDITTKNNNELPEVHVRIKVKYSSPNYKDALLAASNKGVRVNYPHIPGIDEAGRAEESSSSSVCVGEGVFVTGN